LIQNTLYFHHRGTEKGEFLISAYRETPVKYASPICLYRTRTGSHFTGQVPVG
jgi:hypothetical protein